MTMTIMVAISMMTNNINKENMRTVEYIVSQVKCHDVTEAEFDVVQALYLKEMKVVAVKFIRNQYTISLKEAKDICDAIGTTSPYRSF